MTITSTKFNDILVHNFDISELRSNCYILQKGCEGILIDPTCNASLILKFLSENNISLKFMMATHGHFDHVAAAKEIIDSGATDALYIHHLDFIEMRKARTHMMFVLKEKMEIPFYTELSYEQINMLGKWDLCLRHVGGHTKGSCVVYAENLSFLISGDLILHHSLRSKDLDKSENKYEFLMFYKWIKASFNESTLLFPGHGPKVRLHEEALLNKKWMNILNFGE